MTSRRISIDKYRNFSMRLPDTCYQCQIKFSRDDDILSKCSNRAIQLRRYHLTCAKRLNII